VTAWQPDWATLNSVAGSFLASTPLAARIKTVSPVGGYVAIALQANLTDILGASKAVGPLSAPLVIAVDTLVLPAGETAIAAPAVSIVARVLQVAGGGAATLSLGASAPIQVITAAIVGAVSVAQGGTATALALSGLVTPQVLTVTPGSPLSISTTAANVADALHSPWCIVALEVSSAIAGVLVDQDDADAMAMASDMLRWVTAGCSALIAFQSTFTTVDYVDLASLQTASIGLLTFTQAALSGAIYVPVLSSDIYQDEINALLAVAQTYDSKISDLQARKNIDQTLAAFGSTLSGINKDAETPLFNTLQRLNNQSASVQSQLNNAAVQLQQVGATLTPLQEALTEAIQEQFQQELVKTALETFFTVLTLYVGAAAILLGDPEVLSTFSAKALAKALEITKSLIEAGEKTINAAIQDGAAAAGGAPSKAASETAAEGAEYLAGSLASFGTATNALWTVVNAAIAGGQSRINMTPDLLKAVEVLPDLSGFSIGGLDPVTYWDTVVTQTEAAVTPHNDLPQATAYLQAVKLAATYGKAVGDLQMKLLELYTLGMSAFDQLRAVYQAEQEWNDLVASLSDQQSQIDAAIGLLGRGYLDIKRSLVVAVANYRAAFRYQWLQDSEIQVDVSMDLLTLQRQAAKSITSLEAVLAGGAGGITVQPRQNFQNVVYTVSQPLFDATGNAEWSISSDDGQLAGQLSGNTALYLTNVMFELVGPQQGGEVQLQVATSGHYGNRFSSTSYRFVSKPFSMTNDYLPGPPSQFITTWSFTDAAAYIKPTPYTNWTLKVISGNWQGSAIKMTLAGVLLQNSVSARAA
jgi:hypothetical protein